MSSTAGQALLADVLKIGVGEVPASASIDTFPAWDSLTHMRLIAALEQRLGREIASEEILSLDTIGALDAILTQALQ